MQLNHYTTCRKETYDPIYRKNLALSINNPQIYNQPGYLLDITKVDAIFNVGSRTSRDQMILAQLTGLKLNLAITQLDGTGGLIQKNDDICLAGTLDVSGIPGATSYFGTSSPTVQQVVNAIEGKWIGKLTVNPKDWKFNLTNGAKDMFIRILTGINEGTLVTSSGCQ